MINKKHLYFVLALFGSLGSLNALPSYLHYLPAIGTTITAVPAVAKFIYSCEQLRLWDQSAHQEKIAALQEMIARHSNRAVRVIMVPESALNKTGVAFAAAYYSALHREYIMFFSIDIYESAMLNNNKAIMEFFVAHELNHFNNHDVQIVPLTALLAPAITWLATYYAPGSWKFGAGLSASYIVTFCALWHHYNAEKRADNQVAHDPALLQAARAGFERLYTAQKQTQIPDEILWLLHFLKGHVDCKTRINLLDARLAQSAIAA